MKPKPEKKGTGKTDALRAAREKAAAEREARARRPEKVVAGVADKDGAVALVEPADAEKRPKRSKGAP